MTRLNRRKDKVPAIASAVLICSNAKRDLKYMLITTRNQWKVFLRDLHNNIPQYNPDMTRELDIIKELFVTNNILCKDGDTGFIKYNKDLASAFAKLRTG